jgi:hypothetical protein
MNSPQSMGGRKSIERDNDGTLKNVKGWLRANYNL